MSLIACTNGCIYQNDGVCRLERAVSSGASQLHSDCAYFIKKSESGKPRKNNIL